MLRRLQQRLRRNATNVGARTARRRFTRCVLPIVDTRDLKAQLRSANRCHIAAWAATNYNNVKLIHFVFLSPSVAIRLYVALRSEARQGKLKTRFRR
jgi:hypothetical protein